MIEVPVYNRDGESVETVELDERPLGGRIRPPLLKQAYVMYHANRRQGSANTRPRDEKRGSSAKMYRQKGTGRARHGPVRAPQMRGGGVAFAKDPKDWRQRMPKKMRRLATRNALLAKAVDGEIKLVDRFGVDGPKTKQFVSLVEALHIDRTCLAALRPEQREVLLSARNVPDVEPIRIDELNAYALLSNRYLLAEKDALLEWLNNQPASTGSQAQETA